MQETWFLSLSKEDPLEKEMVIHSSTISWKIPWTEVPGRLQSMGSQRVGHDWMTSLSLSLSRLVQWFVWASHRVRFVLIEILFVCLFFLWLARPSEVVTLSADDWVCFVLFLFCFLDEVSCTGCYWWLGDAGSCVQVVFFVWVLTIWYSLGLVLW